MPAMSPHDSNLPAVRRLEAVGLRAWPSSFVHYDGSWQIRLTPGHRSKRLNCVVPLDPSDCLDMAERLEKAGKRFEAAGERLTIRQTPLAPPLLIDHLANHGWVRFETVLVLTLEIGEASLPDTMDHLPTQDTARFAEALMALSAGGTNDRDLLMGILASIKPASGYFLVDDIKAGPQACVLCVQDNDLAGIQSLAVAPAARRQGLGTELLSAALRWARLRGAKMAWLQVSAENLPALALYESLGFTEAYRYHYWRREIR